MGGPAWRKNYTGTNARAKLAVDLTWEPDFVTENPLKLASRREKACSSVTERTTRFPGGCADHSGISDRTGGRTIGLFSLSCK